MTLHPNRLTIDFTSIWFDWHDLFTFIGLSHITAPLSDVGTALLSSGVRTFRGVGRPNQGWSLRPIHISPYATKHIKATLNLCGQNTQRNSVFWHQGTNSLVVF